MSEDNKKVEVVLQHASGAGSWGVADDFKTAHEIAWRHWRGSFGSAGPMGARVLGTDEPMDHIAVVAPTALAAIDHGDLEAIDDWHLHDAFEELSHHVSELKEGMRSLDKASNGDLHRARYEAFCAIRQLADLDHTLAAKLLLRATQERPEEAHCED